MFKKLMKKISISYHLFAFRYLKVRCKIYNTFQHRIELKAGFKKAIIFFNFTAFDDMHYNVNFSGDIIINDRKAMKKVLRVIYDKPIPNCATDLELSQLYKDVHLPFINSRKKVFGKLEDVGLSDTWRCRFY